MPDTDCLPPVAFAGTLAPSFRSLEYERGATPTAHLFDDRYDFRAAVRLINTDRAPNIIDPTVAVQIVLVMRTPAGEPLPLAKALRIAELTRKPDVGILSSLSVGASVAESTLAGVGDGWRLTVCEPPATDLARETAAERQRLATPPPAPTPLSGLGLGGPDDVAGRTALGIAACAAGAWLGSDVLPVYGFIGTSPVTRLFQSGAGGALQERFSGQPVTNANAPHAARVVSVLEKSRTAGLRDLFFRTAIPGMPERQRMEADIDMGAYGIANLGFVTGVDTDGDGLVNQGVQIIGPHPAAAPDGCAAGTNGRCTGGTPQRNLVPTTFHGDVHIRGALVITREDEDYPRHAMTERNFPAGSLVVAGGTFLGPADPSTLLGTALGSTTDTSPNLLDVQVPRVAGGTTTQTYVFRSPGALRVDPSSDVVHMDPGAFHVTASANAAGFDPAGNPTRPALLLEVLSGAGGGSRGQHGMHLINRSIGGDMRLRHAGTGRPLDIRTTQAGVGINLATNSANAPLRLSTAGASSTVSVATTGASAPLALFHCGCWFRRFARYLRRHQPSRPRDARCFQPTGAAHLAAGFPLGSRDRCPGFPSGPQHRWPPFTPPCCHHWRWLSDRPLHTAVFFAHLD